jgi:hypothetical protein
MNHVFFCLLSVRYRVLKTMMYVCGIFFIQCFFKNSNKINSSMFSI